MNKSVKSVKSGVECSGQMKLRAPAGHKEELAVTRSEGSEGA